MVGPGDTQAQGDWGAALPGVPGQRTPRLLEQPARSQAQTGQSQQHRRPGAWAAPLGESARAYPARDYAAVVRTLAQAPWPQAPCWSQGERPRPSCG